ncbi:MAG: tetratricopeptide repeat protein [Nitrospirae bacterium]|nr:MAG: tetratricopeptide repeat protein [Nitrospirota bacterium]
MSWIRKNLSGIIALIILAVLTYTVIYWRTSVEDKPGDYHVRKGNYRLEDGFYEDALKEFRLALEKNPEHEGAYLGMGITYMQMKRYDEALKNLNRAIEIAPELAVAYADRGILYDRLGKYKLALKDYRKALELNPKLADGPGWLWRFLHNIHEKPPTIKDRADYIEAELKKPPEKRLLYMKEKDQDDTLYKY